MRRSVALVILAALATLPATFACSGDVGVVPQCEPDVTDAGIQIVEDGCSGFAICLNDAGNRVPATGLGFDLNFAYDMLFGGGTMLRRLGMTHHGKNG